VRDVRALLEEQRVAFRADPAAAKALTSIGAAPPPTDVPAAELAAWTMVANLILNLDAVLTKG